jgi:hypothetical protein
MIWIYISIGIVVWWIMAMYGAKWMYEDNGGAPRLTPGEHCCVIFLGPFPFIYIGLTKLGAFALKPFSFLSFLLPGTYAVKLYNKNRCDHK